MLDAMVNDGSIAWLAVGALIVELVILLVIRRRGDVGAISPFAANLMSGLFLILALRAALVNSGVTVILTLLGLGFVAHLVDVVLRVRR